MTGLSLHKNGWQESGLLWHKPSLVASASHGWDICYLPLMAFANSATTSSSTRMCRHPQYIKLVVAFYAQAAVANRKSTHGACRRQHICLVGPFLCRVLPNGDTRTPP
eukprot:scaffold106078_cov18-Tisochrysis_lutea.AAC.1